MRSRWLLCALAMTTMPACGASTKTEPSSAAPPSRMAITYLGVAGWKVEAGDHLLLVDPYFSRIDVSGSKGPLSPDMEAIARYAPPHADEILVTHSHYDHLLDVPAIAKRTGAVVVGTSSTGNVARASGLDEFHIRVAHPGDALHLGLFDVQVIAALHSPLGLPNTPIPRAITLPMPAAAYTEGDTLQYVVHAGGHSILFISTANFIESALAGVHPDIAVVAFPRQETITDYPCRLMRVLGNVRLVVPTHFDAHWEPLGPRQMEIEDSAHEDFERISREMHECAPETRFLVPTHFVPIAI